MIPIEIKQFKQLNVYWMITDFCNFRCNYCPSVLHSGNFAQGRKKGFPTRSHIEKFLSILKSEVEKYDLSLNVQFGGGEPTLHPMLPEIIAELKTFSNTIGITTNGSRGISWWEKVWPIDNVTISLHHEFTKIDKVNELATWIMKSKNTSLQFNLSCDPNHWDASMGLYNSLEDYLKPFVSPKVLNHIGTDFKELFNYTPEQRQIIKNLDKKNIRTIMNREASIIKFDNGATSGTTSLAEMTINEWNRFKDWKCYIGKEGLLVNFRGEVYAGVCQVKLLGHMISWELMEEPITCPFQYCACPGDLRSSKFKDQETIKITQDTEYEY